jgi:hypothetical protein
MTILAAGLALVPIVLGLGKGDRETQAPMAPVIFLRTLHLDPTEHDTGAVRLLPFRPKDPIRTT